MADKHLPLLRTRVEIAAACGVAERKITAAFGVARSTQYRWLKAGGAIRAEAYRRKWRLANPDKISAQNKRWAERDPERRRDHNRKGYKKHYAKNPEYYAEKADKRRRGMKEWPCSEVEKLMIKYRYEDARRLSKETGAKYHVDHIIPLAKGGPHLPWNLQVITEEENLSKGARI
jgi:5-methylcytosine-specific restriction endonuclease McrA